MRQGEFLIYTHCVQIKSNFGGNLYRFEIYSVKMCGWWGMYILLRGLDKDPVKITVRGGSNPPLATTKIRPTGPKISPGYWNPHQPAFTACIYFALRFYARCVCSNRRYMCQNPPSTRLLCAGGIKDIGCTCGISPCKTRTVYPCLRHYPYKNKAAREQDREMKNHAG